MFSRENSGTVELRRPRGSVASRSEAGGGCYLDRETSWECCVDREPEKEVALGRLGVEGGNCVA